jgi:hypothetical protein
MALVVFLVASGVFAVAQTALLTEPQPGGAAAAGQPGPAVTVSVFTQPPSPSTSSAARACGSAPFPESGQLPPTLSFTIKESNLPLTSANDKVDLDTGKPGRGPQTQTEISPDRDGRMADLIVERTEIHTGCLDPLMKHLTQQTSDVATCRTVLAAAQPPFTSSISLADLSTGHSICMKTDEGLVALVRITRVSRSYPATVSFEATVARP